MLKSTVAKGLAASLLGTVLVLGVPAQVRAAVFVGAFDPAFGAAFPTLGFRGQGTFLIPDACLLEPGPQVFAEDCGSMSLTSAFVEFYSPPVIGGPTIVSQTFGPHSMDEIVLAAAGNLIAVQTGLVGPENVSIPSIYTGHMWLEFRDGFEDDEGPTAPGAYLWACSTNSTTCETPDIVSNVAPVRFTQIPEPSTIALALAAMAVAGFARRRKSSPAVG